MGQLMIELLLVVVLSFSLMAAVAAQMAKEISAMRAKAMDYGEIQLGESAVRAVEAAMNSGAKAGGSGWEGAAEWRVESGHVRIWHNGRVIEGRGVFSYDDCEPL